MPEEMDRQFDPSVEPESSAAWLAMIEDAEQRFREYNSVADNVDRLYANLDRQASQSRDKEFAMFWANIQVIGPSVYARPPVPVVVPEFQSRDPLKQVTSELLERSLIAAFNETDIDAVMRLVRDDMNIVGRGAPWVRYETKEGTDTEGVCIEFIDRKDFLHDPARYWPEVGWVARRAWKTRKEMKKRFKPYSGDAYMMANYAVQKQKQGADGYDPREKCGVWELWHKPLDKVVWVTEGVEELLDSGPPHLKLEGFFPCPKPAFTTLQRRSLIPIPDMAYYRDQLEEINKLTGRIHALSDAVQVKGFYPGGGEIGDAIEAALNIYDDRKVMIPVSNMAAFGGKDSGIVWMPIDMIATTIAQLIEMRRAIIEDVYQITGISDIMRGDTDAQETLGAQQLKSQYGSIRIREKQAELVRVARDLTRLTAEVMSEKFSQTTLLEMSQMGIPTKADITAQARQIEQQARAQRAQAEQMAAQNPQGAQEIQQQVQQMLEQAAGQIADLERQPTIEDVMKLLRDQKLRPFALDIETDSTIQPDEDAEKQRRTEFLGALGTTIQQLQGLIEVMPQAAGFAGEILKFAMAPFRAGRELQGAIDEFVEQVQGQASQQGQQESPEAIKAKAEAERMQAEMQMKQQAAQLDADVAERKMQYDWQMQRDEMAVKQAESQAESARKDAETQAKIAAAAQKHKQEMEKGQLEIEKIQAQIEAMKEKAVLDERMAQQDADRQKASADQQASLNERAANQKADIAERQAAVKDKA